MACENPGRFAAQHKAVRPLPPSRTEDDAAMPLAGPRQPHMDIALDWLLRLQQSPDDAALKADMAAWEQADPQNAKALRTAQRVWRLTGQLPASTAAQWPALAEPEPEASPLPAPARPSAGTAPPRRRTLRRILSLAVAACLLVALAPRLWLMVQADYRSSDGQRSNVTLADGSRVTLDADSAIAVDITPTQRDVRLLAGQAFFEVARNPAKPFHVLVGELRVTVTGTAFNVDLTNARVNVAVSHGSVNVEQHPSGRMLSQAMLAGQTLAYDRRQGSTQPGKQPVSQVAAWRGGQLIANNARLADVVHSLRRYLPGVVMLRDEQLAESRVTGVYNIDKPDAALAALAQAYGGSVQQFGPWLRVISR